MHISVKCMLFTHYPIASYSLTPCTLSLQGMHATPLKEYRAEIGLTDVLCKLEGSYRSLGEMATRIKLAMDKVCVCGLIPWLHSPKFHSPGSTPRAPFPRLHSPGSIPQAPFPRLNSPAFIAQYQIPGNGDWE